MAPLRTLAMLAALALIGCAGDDIPRVSTDDIDPALAELFGRLVDEARADPASAAARGRLGMAYDANLLFEEADRCYEQARSLDPDDARWWYHAAMARVAIGDVPTARALMDSSLARDDSYATAWVRAGEWQLAEGELDAAERSFQRAVELRPNHPAGRMGLARVHLQRGEPEEAEHLLLEAIERRPHGIYVSFIRGLLGVVYRQTGRLEEARLQLRQGDFGKPDWTDPWRDELNEYRVSLKSRLEDIRIKLEYGVGETTVAELEELRRAHPTHETVLTYLGVAYRQANRPAEAREALEAAVAHHPTDAMAWENLADARAATGDLPGAMEAIDRTLELNPRRPTAHFRRASYLAQAGRVPEALESLDATLAYEAAHVGALKASARLLAARGQAAEAAERWERAFVADPEDVDSCVGAAQAWIMAGRTDRAAELLEQATRLAPEDPRIEPLRRSLP